jgi:hypothetical protein
MFLLSIQNTLVVKGKFNIVKINWACIKIIILYFKFDYLQLKYLLVAFKMGYDPSPY